MKKIGILSLHKVINYGAVLQAYALQEKLRDLGFESEMIDYIPPGIVNPSPLSLMDTLRKLLRHLVRGDFQHLKRRFELLVIKRVEDSLFREDLKSMEERFEHFRKNYLRISDVSYQINNIGDVEMIYDGVITGSDQVWNPLITQNDLTYFLNFLKDGNKKISYAASFGSPDNISEEFKRKISLPLQGIKHLSVRESAGAEMIKDISNRDAEVVVDPVLLLNRDEWDRIIPEGEIKEEYIFCYAFFNDPEISFLCKHLSRITGFKVIRLSLYYESLQRIKEYLDISTTYVNGSGPLEFLSYLRNASIVVTNSFHGVIFSINFRKDFFVIPPMLNMERVVDTLKRYQLLSRLVGKGDILPDKKSIRIEYNKIENILEEERDRSIKFLKNALYSL